MKDEGDSFRGAAVFLVKIRIGLTNRLAARARASPGGLWPRRRLKKGRVPRRDQSPRPAPRPSPIFPVGGS